MITMNIAQLFDDAGLGTAFLKGDETNPDIFVERITLDGGNDSRNGMWIESRGFPLTRGTREATAFDIYARYPAPFTGAQKLKAVRRFLKEAYTTVCELPEVEGVPEVYTNVTLQATSNVENVGEDAEGRIVWVLSAQVSYNEQFVTS